VPDVVVEVELGIIDPNRTTQLEGHRTDPLPVAGEEGQLRADQRFELAVVGGRVGEDAGHSDVHVDGPVLQMEEFGIESAESVHRRHRPPAPACSSWPRPDV
jgi:hypothetical protein